MKITHQMGAKLWAVGAMLCGGLSTVYAQDDAMKDSSMMNNTTMNHPMHSKSKTMNEEMAMDKSAMKKMSMSDMKMKNAQMLIQTLSEEKTEISALTAQQAALKKMGGSENMKLASLWGRMIAEHKAGGPMFMKLIKANGGDPMDAKVLKAPVLGSTEKMVMATHKDHQAAVMTSQMRHGLTNSSAVEKAMHKRANLARKHIKWMMPMMHDMHADSMNGQKVAMMCPHCDVKMVNGKCPMCGMTATQMKADMKKM